MKIYLYDKFNRCISTIKDIKSTSKSYSRLLKFNSYYYSPFYLEVAITPISIIKITIEEEDIVDLKSYMRVVNFAFSVLNYCKPIYELDCSNKELIVFLVKMKYDYYFYGSDIHLESFIDDNIKRDDRINYKWGKKSINSKIRFIALKPKNLI